MVQYGAVDNSYFEYDELTVIHDGTTANLLEYGQLSTDILSPTSSSGIGTYSVYLSGSDLKIDLIPNNPLSVQHNISTIQVSISNTSYVGIGTSIINNSKLSSNYVSISSSTSPTNTIISSYNNEVYSCAYCLVSIEDLTNNSYRVSEVLIADNKNSSVGFASTSAYATEFGVIETGNSLGTISADISGTNTVLYFTPIPNADVQIRVFQHSLGLVDIDITETFINF